MGAFSIWHWLVVLAIVLLVFGPGRLGNLGKDLGKSIKEFRESMNEKNITPDKIEDQPKQAQSTTTTTETHKDKV